MIRRIIFSTIFVLLVFAISLSLMGVEHVELGPTFLSFLRNCSRELESFKIAIPNIPTIPPLDDVSGAWAVVDVLVKFINGIVNILNFLVLVLNTIIQLIEFVIIILKNFIIARDSLIGA